MSFYKDIFYYISFLLIYLCVMGESSDLSVIKSGLDDINPCAVGMQFFALVNNNSTNNLIVELLPDECCIDFDSNLDCDSLKIMGDCVDVMPQGTTKNLKVVAPTLYPLTRKGYCTLHLDSRVANQRRPVQRETITIKFDTGIENIPKDLLFEEKIKICKNTDEDPLNDCRPIDCDFYYNGAKSFYDKRRKRCVAPETCKKDDEIYDPNNNQCVLKDEVTADDINFVKSLSENHRDTKDVIILKRILKPVKATEDAKTVSESVTEGPKQKTVCTKLKDYVRNNKHTLLFLLILLLMQFVLVFIIVSCLSTYHECCGNKKLVRNFFNYRNDASVTTPLIGTSNIDTETTDFDYVSETTADKKIRCYKACEKENDGKADDILTKCLNRRDWRSKSDTKIDFDEKDEMDLKDTPSKHSETVIVTHDYNIREANSQDHRLSPCKETISLSTEKGAQACFSNDTLDDFLSERGVVMFGDNMSFVTDSSRPRTSTSDLSSRTSKNNIIRNFLNYLSRKSKMVVTSEPGFVKTAEDDLELLHMSPGSVYSDSDSGYRKMKNVKMVKESRSTF